VVGRSWLELAAIAAAISFPAIASASETINYSSDAKERLVKVARSGSVNPGVNANYSYDKAGNRTKVTVAGSFNPPPP
jgi:hypothetical protein